MMTSLGRCCWPGRRFSQSSDWSSSCNVREKMREGGENDETGMVSDIDGAQSQGGREMSSSMRDWICVSVTGVVVAVVVVTVALMVAMGVKVLMVVVGIVVLVMVVRVLGIGVVEIVRYCV